MQLPTISILLPFLPALATSAALPRDDAHVADFRTFGEVGCGAENQGIWTLTQSQLADGCKPFPAADSGTEGGDDGEAVRSVALVDIAEGCSLTLYTDDSCSEKAAVPDAGECSSLPTEYKSFLITC